MDLKAGSISASQGIQVPQKLYANMWAWTNVYFSAEMFITLTIISKVSVTPQMSKAELSVQPLYFTDDRCAAQGGEFKVTWSFTSTDSWSFFVLSHRRIHVLRWNGAWGIVKLRFAKVLKFSHTLESYGSLVGKVVPMCSQSWESLG